MVSVLKGPQKTWLSLATYRCSLICLAHPHHPASTTATPEIKIMSGPQTRTASHRENRQENMQQRSRVMFSSLVLLQTHPSRILPRSCDVSFQSEHMCSGNINIL